MAKRKALMGSAVKELNPNIVSEL